MEQIEGVLKIIAASDPQGGGDTALIDQSDVVDWLADVLIAEKGSGWEWTYGQVRLTVEKL